MLSLSLDPLYMATAGRNHPSGDLADCSSLLSIIRSFDSVLAAYEGFCNLKQVGDLLPGLTIWYRPACR